MRLPGSVPHSGLPHGSVGDGVERLPLREGREGSGRAGGDSELPEEGMRPA